MKTQEITKMKRTRIKILTCCFCGRETIGRQWWNQDKGYGPCTRCVTRFLTHNCDEATVRTYGINGINYNLEVK